uniref:Uncharacterized protein n=1 Tax=Arundo donax TaxID=35708 RepID=A0A0A9BE56_ARUDO
MPSPTMPTRHRGAIRSMASESTPLPDPPPRFSSVWSETIRRIFRLLAVPQITDGAALLPCWWFRRPRLIRW